MNRLLAQDNYSNMALHDTCNIYMPAYRVFIYILSICKLCITLCVYTHCTVCVFLHEDDRTSNQIF